MKSVLHLVDLAGSERLKKSKVEGVHKSEAININSSLMVLGKCVNALVEKKRHVPYFESKVRSGRVKRILWSWREDFQLTP